MCMHADLFLMQAAANLGYICAVSRLYLDYISAVSRLYLRYISAVSALYPTLYTSCIMQNFSHVLDVFSELNAQPKQQRDTDFNRVRMYHLEGLAKRVRQTAVL